MRVRLEYKPVVMCWYMGITYGDFEVDNLQIVSNANIVREYKNILPFSFMCDSSTGELGAQDDFSSGRVALYILDGDDVGEIERVYQKPA